ncbi:hypothetical protein ACJJIW_20810 [Microbulbifer sp. JMSA004]|uniref:hypothetical protein n=1 Tax=unclassified Microbulbifer TaxID=2619833 RepID=UPI0024AD8A1B|nr:hypothetical protein [Microbulbifer sp. VAAF005]WHI46428.1 hypothetical protein P0078_22405 [Microbulbifer sp. VAAF005]
MKIECYQLFKEYKDKGLKKKSSKSIRTFISQFENDEEINSWVWECLPKLETNRHSRIRYEIFRELVCSILKCGSKNNDFSSTLWLGKLAQIIYQAQQLDKEHKYSQSIKEYIKKLSEYRDKLNNQRQRMQ